MRTALDHIGLLTTEIDESVRFYTNTLGMQIRSPTSNAGTSEIVWLDDGSRATKVLLCLIGPPFSTWMETFIANHGPMLGLLGFEVDDLDEWFMHIQSEDIELLSSIQDNGEGRHFYLRDPAGIGLKLTQKDPTTSPSIAPAASSALTSNFRLSHTNITVRDITVLENFYVNTLGMKTVIERREEGMIFLADQVALSDADHDVFPLELFGPPGLWEADVAFLEKHGAGLQYLCFAVDDVDRAYQGLCSKGVDFHLDPTDFGDNRVAFFKDPNGVDIEILLPISQISLRGSANA
jgi:catechol 2,3-dioxygenase-like lactoylglutathione lyase family enzyme